MSGIKGKTGIYKRIIGINYHPEIQGFQKGHPNCSFKKGEGIFKGKKLSKEHREKMRNAKLEKKQPNISKALLGMKRSEESKRKHGQSISGEKHWNWQGGTPVVINRTYTNYRWKKLRLKILIRDSYRCFICKNVFEGKKLLVHHKEKYKLSKNNNLDNLMTVCRSCHLKKVNRLHLL